MGSGPEGPRGKTDLRPSKKCVSVLAGGFCREQSHGSDKEMACVDRKEGCQYLSPDNDMKETHNALCEFLTLSKG